MFDIDFWREVFQSIDKNRTRSLLSGFTVAFAILLFTVLFGLANGLNNTFSEAFVDSFNNPVPERTMAALFGSTEATDGWKGAGARLLATVPTLLDGVGSAGCLLDAPSSDPSITDPTTGPFINGCMRTQSSVWSGGRLK